MVHRALLGSIERFLGVLIEHYGGAFPLWLAPVQAVVIPIADRHAEYAKHVVDDLRRRAARRNGHPATDAGEDPRRAAAEGALHVRSWATKEQEADAVAVRRRDGSDLGRCRCSR